MLTHLNQANSAFAAITTVNTDTSGRITKTSTTMAGGERKSDASPCVGGVGEDSGPELGLIPFLLEASSAAPDSLQVQQEVTSVLMHMADDNRSILSMAQLECFPHVLTTCVRFQSDPAVLANTARLFFRCALFSDVIL